MEKICKTINGVDVIFIRTNKFKSLCGGLFFKSPVTRRKITSYNLMRKVLLRSTKKYDTEEKLNLNILENYNAYYSSGTTRMGNYIINSFYFETLCDKYTEDGNLKKIIDTFNEIVFNPNLSESNSFKKEEFDFCFDKELTSLDKIKESQKNYASYKITDYFNKDKAYSYHETKEELSNLDAKKLYDDYLDMINNSETTLIIVGDVDPLDNTFKSIISNIKNVKKYENPLIILNDDEKEEFNEEIEDGDGTENILNIVYYLKGLSEYELNYVMPIYRYILGGSGNSRLFNEVREKNSLAYYIYARYEKDDSIINIVTGVEKNNYEKAMQLIKKEVKSMEKITEGELLNAKKYLSSSLIVSQDYLSNMMSRCYTEKLFSLPKIDDYLKLLNNVTTKEVEIVSKKVFLALSYFLKGRDSDE